MKSCPKCNRTFPDEGQKFCTFDGGLLIAPQTFDPNATIRATSVDLVAPTDKATSRELPDPNATIVEHFPQTVALPRNTGPTSTPNTADIVPSPPPPPQVQQSAPVPPPPPQPEIAPPVSAPLPQQPVSQPAAAPAKKKGSKVPLIIAGVLVLLLLGGGGLAALFFFVVKPKMDEMQGRRNPEAPVASPSVTAETSPTPVPSPSVASDTFVPPPDSVQFVNSNATLDGRLAEHYLDFSFYYPKGWTKDPKSGVPGAANFILVERALPTKETQENVAASWYTSAGTFVADLPNFPKRVEEVSASLAKQFDGYEKVSEGPTKVNSLEAYEFRWKASAELPTRGPVELWGRVVFIPTGNEGDSTGIILRMFSTSLAPELGHVEDLGTRGQAPLILESFRFGKKS